MKTIDLRDEMNSESACTELDLETLETVVGGGLSVGTGYSASSYGGATIVTCNGEVQYMQL